MKMIWDEIEMFCVGAAIIMLFVLAVLWEYLLVFLCLRPYNNQKPS